MSFLQSIIEKVKGGDLGKGPGLVAGAEWVLYRDPFPWPSAES